MPIKGSIRENSTMHRVAEAILTHPELYFTAPKIWKILHNDYPDITVASVSTCITKKNTPLSKLFKKTADRDGMADVYVRSSNSEMPLIVTPKSKPKIKSKKIEPIPNTVIDYQIGQSIILYIEKLRNKIKDLATAVGNMQAKHKSEINLSKMTLKQRDNTIEKFEEELKTLRASKDIKSRTFKMNDLL